jgi:HPt (histidine-containing phosphotransfer) domain-containing protein
MPQETPGLAADTVEYLRELGGEDLLRRLVTLLFELAPQRLHTLEGALLRSDLPAARRAAHALCSTAGTVGATGLLEAARLVERATGLPELLAATGRLEREWDRLQEPLRVWLDQPGLDQSGIEPGIDQPGLARPAGEAE